MAWHTKHHKLELIVVYLNLVKHIHAPGANLEEHQRLTLIRWPLPSQAAPAKRDANRGLASMCDLFGVMAASSDPCQPPGACTEIWQSLTMRTGYLHGIFLPRCLCSGILHCLCFSPGLCLSRRQLCLPPDSGPVFCFRLFQIILIDSWSETAGLQSMYAPSSCPCKARWVLASILCTGWHVYRCLADIPPWDLFGWSDPCQPAELPVTDYSLAKAFSGSFAATIHHSLGPEAPFLAEGTKSVASTEFRQNHSGPSQGLS